MNPPVVPGTWVESDGTGSARDGRVRAQVKRVKVVLVVDNHGYEQEWEVDSVHVVESGCAPGHPCAASVCDRSIR